MNNQNSPAFPTEIAFNEKTKVTTISHGLTKREYFAGLAMQGYIVERHGQDDIDRAKVAKWSVKLADELLKQLEKQP
jgi:hypothetical protein